MKTIKRMWPLMLLPFLMGCAGIGGQTEITPAFVQQSVDDAVGIDATIQIKKAPPSVAAFAKARDALDSLVRREHWNLAAFAEALAAADIDAVTQSNLELYVVPGIQLVSLFLHGQNVDLAQVVYARAVIIGADNALNRVLGPKPPVPVVYAPTIVPDGSNYRYTVIESNNRYQLSANIDALPGWKPLGGVSLTWSTKDQEWVYAQAMIGGDQ